jgi:hypothetical protein
MRSQDRASETPRRWSPRSERSSADSGPAQRTRRARDTNANGVCCDEQMVGAERFPRKGDVDEFDE